MLFFANCTRPDISYAVNSLCRHLHRPNAACFSAVERLIRYLRDTPDLGLLYVAPDPDTPLSLEVYADASYGGEHANQARSQHGYLVYFGGNLIDWNSTLQNTVAVSSAEAEFIAAYHAARTTAYFRQLLDELDLHQTRPTIIWEDNTACISQSRNPVNHKRCKHILLKYHYLRVLNDLGIIRLEYISTTAQLADALTKPLAPQDFLRLRTSYVAPILP